MSTRFGIGMCAGVYVLWVVVALAGAMGRLP